MDCLSPGTESWTGLRKIGQEFNKLAPKRKIPLQLRIKPVSSRKSCRKTWLPCFLFKPLRKEGQTWWWSERFEWSPWFGTGCRSSKKGELCMQWKDRVFRPHMRPSRHWCSSSLRRFPVSLILITQDKPLSLEQESRRRKGCPRTSKMLTFFALSFLLPSKLLLFSIQIFPRWPSQPTPLAWNKHKRRQRQIQGSWDYCNFHSLNRPPHFSSEVTSFPGLLNQNWRFVLWSNQSPTHRT